MRIVIICEGATEQALGTGLRGFLQQRGTVNPRTGITLIAAQGRVTGRSASPLVRRYLRNADVAGVVLLTDVYPDHQNAKEAKAKLEHDVGDLASEHRLRFHAAQYEVEAWIIPFWDDICRSLQRSLKAPPKKPGQKPEEINGHKPPSKHLRELYSRAKSNYQKPKHAPKWLTAERLPIAAEHCPELKSFLNSLLEFAGADAIP